MPRLGTWMLSALSVLILVFAITTCGSSSRQLESITISSGGNVSMQYSASGTYNHSPTSVTPLPVSWYVVNPNVSPAITGQPTFGYNLTTQPYELSPCLLTDTVIALAPANPNAPTSGALPSQVYQDLVIAHSVSKEGGFVAAAAPANCSR